jgi:hypothetical protein
MEYIDYIKKCLSVTYAITIFYQLTATAHTVILEIEIIIDLVVFPLAWLWSPLLLCHWMVDSS